MKSNFSFFEEKWPLMASLGSMAEKSLYTPMVIENDHHSMNNLLGVGSYSFLMIPDIVLEKKEVDGSIKTVILDPKYRVGRTPILEALGDMHKYKDALVDGYGKKIISAAFILVPNTPTDTGIVARYCPWDYKLRHGFGVCALSPGNESNLDELNELLLTFGI